MLLKWPLRLTCMGGAGFTLANLKGQKMQAHQLEHDMASYNMATCHTCILLDISSCQQRGCVCHSVAFAIFTLKSILMQKKNYENFKYYFTMQK